ncbi:MAG TPA: N-acetyl-gamma-glutamyl-phosphate reductase [Candidatus Thermoplasmatota archaeon]|nr:N-acetyl-gamma-glutamyl-phosphate reductase [Candidatus Thermoplasmatota archaeon]
MTTVAVIGARGYLGRELVRFLLAHPEVDRIVTASVGGAGGPYKEAVPAFAGIPTLSVVAADDNTVREADAVFLATASGEAKTLLPALVAAGPKVIIDLSRDHRHEGLSKKDGWVYGMPEAGLPVAKGAKKIANPGCYPTAAILSLAPALSAGLLAPGPVIVDGKSGVSGAGATPRPDLHFAETNESVRAYKVLGHDHEEEMRLAAARVAKGQGPAVRFTPHLVPMNRGLLTTAYAPIAPGVTVGDLQAAYKEAYAATVFVSLVQEADTAHVRGSNRAHIAVDVHPETGLVVARGAIDNLAKGGAGAAVQNLNRALGFNETYGLPLVGGTP